MADPVYLERHGHRTWLKWHRGRRKASDPAFTGARILEAMRLGASVEVDLVIHANHGCAILHDTSLERETTGTGKVRDASAETLRALHLRGNDGTPLPDRVMVLEDLCALLRDTPPHPDALLQLDFKEDRAALDAVTIANFGVSVSPVASHVILSGGDLNAISPLANSAEALRIGYDPCYGESLARLQASGDFSRFISDALAAAPDAEMIYLAWEIVLAAQDVGFDIVAPIHRAGRRIDAWTIRQVTPETLAQVDRLLALQVDQITTDDPEGLFAARAE
ncbi:MAG TPA: glycerophosphodiester phosphodiesterase family protein [Devosia sp.]|jgi:glycerophosphoryl diester phosphodiesterase|nr:glycerophosphodiester phosphodiesterase family protein [Devosia sp.]